MLGLSQSGLDGTGRWLLHLFVGHLAIVVQMHGRSACMHSFISQRIHR